jgi:16S rRNA (adenine1518-N6/adenine1519-N6)-dimethyltransferase
MARAKLGQHWLVDKRAVRRIADEIGLAADETCIEIGGGKGALTRVIAPICRRLIVYEIDPKWAAHLREHIAGWVQQKDRPGGDVDRTDEVREIDALRIEWSRESLGIEAGEPLVITGNLPYYLTSPLLLRLAYSRLDFNRALFLIQKEVAERIAAKPSDSNYGRLTVSLGAFLETKTVFNVPPDAFKPPPKVTSTLIRMIPRKTPLIEPELTSRFEWTVQAAFHMRRKKLKNNLLAGFPEVDGKEIERILADLGVSPNARAQEIEVERFAALARALSSEEGG